MIKKVTCVAVVLHYIGIEDTRECVSSFLEKCSDTDVIIVDNASPNETGRVLYEEYQENPRVTVILNENNLGFSAGNNVGIEYAKKNYDFSYLIIANNDTLILDDHFVSLVQQTYEKEKFSVLGPMILTADGRCDSNPLYYFPYTREKALHDIEFHQKRIRSIQNPIYGFLYHLGKKIKRKFGFDDYKKYDRKKSVGKELIFPHEDVVLHGSFLVFSMDYFAAFSGLDDRTFLYAEEDILYQHCKHRGLKMYYCPQIIVYHKEGGAVKSKLPNKKEKDLFFSRHAISAIKAYLELLDEYKDL